MNKKHLRFLSLASFILGVAFLLNSKIDITGAVIGTSVSSGFSSILGLVLILVSVVMFMGGRSLEEELESIRKAISREVPRGEAKELHRYANEKVSNGEWIELARSSDADYANSKNLRFDFNKGGSLHEASAYRFFGPKKILRDYQREEIEKRVKKQSSLRKSDRKNRYQIAKDVVKNIKFLPENRADKYFNKGIIPGKTHEVIGGYELHGGPIEGENYLKESGGWVRRNFLNLLGKGGIIGIGEKRFLLSSKIGQAYLGGRVSHRHWELKPMYENKKEKNH